MSKKTMRDVFNKLQNQLASLWHADQRCPVKAVELRIEAESDIKALVSEDDIGIALENYHQEITIGITPDGEEEITQRLGLEDLGIDIARLAHAVAEYFRGL